MKKQPPKRQIEISKLAKQIQNKFGSNSAVIPGDDNSFMLNRIEHWISAGAVLNPVVGNASFGLPCGYYVELSGGESHGKTTFAYYLLGCAQKNGVVPILGDVEHSYNQDWAEKQGLDSKNLLLIESAYSLDKSFKVETVDEQFEKWEYTIRQSKELYGRPNLLVVDSLAALMPKEFLIGEYGDRSVAALARALAQNMPRFQSTLIETCTSCVFVNQLRDKIGVLWGEREGTPGGRAKNFYFFTRLKISKIKTLKKGTNPTGILTRLKNTKNKVDVPFKQVEITIDFEKGIQL